MSRFGTGMDYIPMDNSGFGKINLSDREDEFSPEKKVDLNNKTGRNDEEQRTGLTSKGYLASGDDLASSNLENKLPKLQSPNENTDDGLLWKRYKEEMMKKSWNKKAKPQNHTLSGYEKRVADGLGRVGGIPVSYITDSFNKEPLESSTEMTDKVVETKMKESSNWEDNESDDDDPQRKCCQACLSACFKCITNIFNRRVQLR